MDINQNSGASWWGSALLKSVANSDVRGCGAGRAAMPGAAHWRGVQLVDVRCKTAYLPHLLRNPTLRATLARCGLADNPLLDLLHIAAHVS